MNVYEIFTKCSADPIRYPFTAIQNNKTDDNKSVLIQLDESTKNYKESNVRGGGEPSKKPKGIIVYMSF